ncbi:HNH endonuclease [Deinococcus sp. ME38]|uniref:HNH endonuclease n=1 Tax=Deinococcus sp. ME38 TaxID=3400344 RepID=UPI003B58EFDE
MCRECGYTLPLDESHFTRHGRGFKTSCLNCSAVHSRNSRIQYACKSCKKIYPNSHEYFYSSGVKNLRGEKILSSLCKNCHNEKRKSLTGSGYHSDWRARNLDKARESGRAHYHKNKEKISAARSSARRNSLEASREAEATRRALNPERFRRAERNYRQKNRDLLRIKRRDYMIRNPEKIAQQQRNRYARKKGASGSYSSTDILVMKIEQSGKCFYCKKPLDFETARAVHVDHKIPISRGGSNFKENLCLACSGCNCSKQAKTAEEFIVAMSI